eukprot:2838032-Prorocentrum_lima.AAC.1
MCIRDRDIVHVVFWCVQSCVSPPLHHRRSASSRSSGATSVLLMLLHLYVVDVRGYQAEHAG